MKLRPYQTKIIAEVLASWQSGKRRVMATAPTGSGKTVLFAKIADKHLTDVPDGKVWIIAHRQYPDRRRQCPCDSAPGMGKKGGVGRTYADAPEIDGTVKLLPPEKISKTLKVGEFTKARIVGTQGHDLVALPI